MLTRQYDIEYPFALIILLLKEVKCKTQQAKNIKRRTLKHQKVNQDSHVNRPDSSGRFLLQPFLKEFIP